MVPGTACDGTGKTIVYILYGLWCEMLDVLFFFSVTPESIVS
jgi:hypothetical protein